MASESLRVVSFSTRVSPCLLQFGILSRHNSAVDGREGFVLFENLVGEGAAAYGEIPSDLNHDGYWR
jgi:hypothetical protein